MEPTVALDPNTVQQQQEQGNIYGCLANFEIDKRIGKGQFSEVFRARCKIDNSVVALKKVQVNVKSTSFLACLTFDLINTDI